MIKAIYLQTWEILKKVPVKLWGLTLLNGLLSVIVVIFGVLPIVTIPISAALSAGLVAVFYKAYKNGGEADSKTMFKPFTDFRIFKRTAGGICWMYLWIILWFLIPIAGPFLAIYKSLQYQFTPYILNEEPTVSGIDALKKSKEDTNGYKLNMFIAIVLPNIGYAVASGILSALGLIPFAGIVFNVINAILGIVYSLVAPLFFGLVDAGFYDYGKKPAYVPPAPKSAPVIQLPPQTPAAPAAETTSAEAAPVSPAQAVTAAPKAVTCPTCGTENSPEKKFCIKCGGKL